MTFQYKTTLNSFIKEADAARWIYVTWTMRKTCMGLYAGLTAVMLGALTAGVYLQRDDDYLWLFVAMLGLIALGFFCQFVREFTWRRWKKDYICFRDSYQKSLSQPDKSMSIDFSDEGILWVIDDREGDMIPWKMVTELRENRHYWDLILNSGMGSTISVEKGGIAGGTEEEFAAFVQKRSKRKLKPRKVEHGDIYERYFSKWDKQL